MARKSYCDDNCKDNYHCDRQHGLIYGAIGIERDKLPDGFTNFSPLSDDKYVMVGWEDGCKILNACRYCFTEL